MRAQNLDPFLTGRRGKAASKRVILMTPDFLYSERPRSQDGPFALESHATIRHVFLTNTFLAPVKDAVLEQRIIDFAKTNQLGVASTVVLHRFVMSDTVPWLRNIISSQMAQKGTVILYAFPSLSVLFEPF